uniref:ETS domain-containing protein n=1 Tax=Arion vulgaris TaxID=1028688 RepID=A0A0B6ZJP0_9EUPU
MKIAMQTWETATVVWMKKLITRILPMSVKRHMSKILGTLMNRIIIWNCQAITLVLIRIFHLTAVRMNIDPATPDSDGYESSSADIISSSQYVSIENSADLKFNSQSHVYRQDEIGTFTQIYSGHESSSSDEGYGEGNLPDFEKLQNRPDPDKVSQRKRNNALNSKAKKRTTKESVPFIEKERRKPGRKPGQVSNVLHLWEFMRNLLQNSEYEGIIEWISKSEGVFRVMNSTEVARLWGEKKKNKKQMTYEKLSRSLRYSRLEGYFAELPRDKNYPKKLCFKFGPKSRNWC